MSLILSKFGKSFENLMERISKRPGEETPRWMFWLVSSLVLLFIGLAFGSIFWGYFSAPGRFTQVDPSLLIPKDSWKVLYENDGRDCGVIADKACPAHPFNPSLWHSAFSRQDSEHSLRVAQRRGKVFWIGTKIDRELLKQAGKKEANNLILGTITADSQVYFNGKLILKRPGLQSRSDMVFSIPYDELLSGSDPLFLAVRIEHNAGANFPDMLSRGKEGFASTVEAQGFVRRGGFLVESRPLMQFVFNVMIAILFFFFFVSSPLKSEFGYLAAYAGVQAFIQSWLLDYVYKGANFDVSHWFWLMNSFFEGGFGLILAMSYSRVRHEAFPWTLAFLLGFPGLLWLQVKAADYLAINEVVGRYFVVPAYIAGALLCLMQLIYLRRQLNLMPYLRKRIFRLANFSLAILLLAVVYWLDTFKINSPAIQFIDRLGHIFITIYLVVVVLTDYKDAEKQIRQVSLSVWHRMNPMPKEVLGATFRIDLKSSVLLAERSNVSYHEFIRGWSSLLNETAIRLGMKNLDDEGDEITYFIESTSPLKAVEIALNFMRTIKDEQKYFLDQYSMSDEMHFRCALVTKPIQPIWKKVGNQLKPDFDGEGWVESKRFLEVEAEYLDKLGIVDKNITTLILDAESVLVQANSNLEQLQPLGESRSMIDKNKKVRKIVAFTTIETNQWRHTG